MKGSIVNTQTAQTAKEHLKALHEELKAAAAQSSEATKEHIRAAISHAQAAKAEFRTKLTSEHAKDKVNAEHVLQKLEESTSEAKRAMDAKGAEVGTHLKQSLAAAKAALEK
jgi:DNA invertase Pin-like site-specific DNA recombinase